MHHLEPKRERRIALLCGQPAKAFEALRHSMPISSFCGDNQGFRMMRIAYREAMPLNSLSVDLTDVQTSRTSRRRMAYLSAVNGGGKDAG